MPHKDPEAKKAYMKDRYQEKAEEIKEYQREYRANNKEKVNAARVSEIRGRKEQAVSLLGGQCSRCGFDSDIAALQFHHRDPKAKQFTISKKLSNKSVPWDTLVEEILKCDLLCANCHFIHHASETEARPSEGYRIKFTATPEEVRSLYWDKGMSLREIGEQYGVDRTVVHTFMQKHEIERRNTGEGKRLKSSRDKELIALGKQYLQGQIAEEMGLEELPSVE